MRLIKNTTWEEVFECWRKNEASNPGWIRYATEIKGWPDWESWRKHSASQIEADKRHWQIYQFTDPLHEIPAMLVGPYSSWQTQLPKKNIATFDDLLNIPEQLEKFSKHEGVLSVLSGLPFTTEFIGVIRDDVNKIVCLEGHHRATAIALAKKQKKKLDFSNTKITIALTHLSKDEACLLDKILARGTTKNPSQL